MSIFDLIEQQIALHRELFGDKPTHIALCQRHMNEVAQRMGTPTEVYKPAVIAGLHIDVTPIGNHLPYIY